MLKRIFVSIFMVISTLYGMEDAPAECIDINNVNINLKCVYRISLLEALMCGNFKAYYDTFSKNNYINVRCYSGDRIFKCLLSVAFQDLGVLLQASNTPIVFRKLKKALLTYNALLKDNAMNLIVSLERFKSFIEYKDLMKETGLTGDHKNKIKNYRSILFEGFKEDNPEKMNSVSDSIQEFYINQSSHKTNCNCM